MRDSELVIRIVTDIAAPPQRVWEVLTDLGSYAAWHPNMRLRGPDQPISPGSVLPLRTNAGTPAELDFDVTVVEVDGPAKLTWEGGVRGTFFGRHRYTLVPDGDGTRLIDEEEFSGDMAAAVLSQNRPTVEAQYSTGDAALKARAEAALVVSPPVTPPASLGTPRPTR